MNKGFIDGVRGFVMILVLVDHKNLKLLADTSLFLILTGFTTALQEYSMMNAQEDNQQLNNNTDTKNNADPTSLQNEVVISTTKKNFSNLYYHHLGMQKISHISFVCIISINDGT
jgi:hypothetical protein